MKILFNDIAAVATSVGATTLADGYDLKTIANARRCEAVKTEASASDIRVAYTLGANQTYAYAIITNAKAMVTAAGARVAIVSGTGGGTFTDIEVFSPLVAGDLVGITGQDLVVAITPDSGYLRRYGVTFNSLGTEALKLSTMAFALDAGVFAQAPDFGSLEVSEFGGDYQSYTTPRLGLTYDTEALISLTWSNVSTAEVSALFARPYIYDWPCFLYDAAGNLFSHKLEHVLIERISTTFLAADSNQVNILFRRLRHYA